MSDTDLEALAERVVLKGACRETDARIWCAISADKEWNLDLALSGAPKPAHCTVLDLALDAWLDRFPENAEDYAGAWAVPKFTASIDAAMSLVPEELDWILDNFDGPVGRRCSASINSPVKGWSECHAATPALALCAASLKARARALSRLSPPNEVKHVL